MCQVDAAVRHHDHQIPQAGFKVAYQVTHKLSRSIPHRRLATRVCTGAYARNSRTLQN
jgi:hypothetical protein